MQISTMQRFIVSGVLALACVLTTGCGISGSGYQVPTQVKGSSVHGTVLGGQQPVASSTIQLYATGTSGYGSASTPLISAAVQSDADGDFSITSDYTCPSASTPVYITARGGNSTGGSPNNNLAMMAALGPCGNLSSSTNININEVTTVGSVWALAPFMSGPAAIGAPSTNAMGLANAMADVNVLVDTSVGVAPGALLAPGVSVPTSEIYTLADIIAACINTSGGTAGDGTACGQLFSATTQGTAPTETLTAALNMALHPASNVTALYNLALPASPFQPSLSSRPNDFTIAVSYSGGNLNAPSAVAADASGNIWIANSGANTLTELAHNGSVLSGTGYTNFLNAPSSVAISTDGTVWVTNGGNNTVSRFTAAGSAYAAPYSGGGLSSPSAIAFDSTGTAWITNGGNSSVTTINSSGTTLTNYTPAGVAVPLAIAVNPH